MNYIPYHVHSDLSVIDSATKFESYILRAKELNMKAIAFTEHGNIFSWVKKKQMCDKNGIKYIHGIEAYLTKSLDEKVRDNYHVVLLAKNYQGVLELNQLSSRSYNKMDGHFYYDPRITIDELLKTSDNIIVTTACLGGVLGKGLRNEDYELADKFIEFLKLNKHRCFLEVQYHNIPEQREYNQLLYKLSKLHGIPLIAGTDTHAIDEAHGIGTIILKLAKSLIKKVEEKIDWENATLDKLNNIFNGLDLTFKTYDELVKAFKTQDSLPKEVYLQAIENTNLLYEMVEDFDFDRSHKYPKIADKPEKLFKEKIEKGIKKRGINKHPTALRKTYYDRIRNEYSVYKKLDSIQLMLFQEEIISWCRENDIEAGYGRGSVNGSEIAYVLGLTEMDSIKHNLNFFRFMNPSRVTLADIDTDYPPSQRSKVIHYIATRKGIHFAEIITFNTIALKGSIREVGRALDMDLGVIDTISKNIETKEQEFRRQYPVLFRYVDILNGVNISIGSHPSGFITSPITLEDHIGTCYTSESKYPVSQINMKELEELNYVKLDCLGLDNIEIINETCKLLGIPRLTPDNVNDEDNAVWESIKESSLGVFQFEGQFAHDTLIKVLNMVDKLREINPNVRRIDLMSMTNGAIRPAGASYRDLLCQGVFKNNGHKALNDFLSDTLGYLIYQEQIMKFLTLFCDFSDAESDNVRRGLAKKIGTEKFLPDIKKGFISFMENEYGVSKKEANDILSSFLKVIEDASQYGFSINHSQPYTYTGYICAYLRYYYPREFLTVMLNINNNDIAKTSEIVKYANEKGIRVLPITFRKSQEGYSCSDEGIYKGLKSIKYLNSKIAKELNRLNKVFFSDFIDLLVHLTWNTTLDIRQIKILTALSYFDEFGGNGKLLKVIEQFEKRYKKGHIQKTRDLRVAELKEYTKGLTNYKLPIRDQIKYELEYLGYIETKVNIEGSYVAITEVNTKYTPRVKTYCFKTGKQETYKIYKSKFNEYPLDVGDIIKIYEIIEKPRVKLINGVWVEQEETELIITKYGILREEKGEEDDRKEVPNN